MGAVPQHEGILSWPVWTDGSQIDFYDQKAAVGKAVEAAVRHFRETLD